MALGYKVIKKSMKYELCFIISGALAENEHGQIEKDVLAYLDMAGAQHAGRIDSMGRKKLAYPIKGQKHGFYMFLRFDLEEKSKIKEMETKLRQHPSLLRHLLVKLEPAALRPPVKRERPMGKEIKKESVASTHPTSVEKAASPKIELDDLADIDKQLDEILEREP